MKPQAMVYCRGCGNEHTVEEVEFVDIEEDWRGADLMTFICPDTFTEEKSNVYGG